MFPEGKGGQCNLSEMRKLERRLESDGAGHRRHGDFIPRQKGGAIERF